MNCPHCGKEVGNVVPIYPENINNAAGCVPVFPVITTVPAGAQPIIRVDLNFNANGCAPTVGPYVILPQPK